jgi:hypothetical protein
MPKAAMADLHAAVREAVLEEPAEHLDGVEGGGTLSNATGFAVGDGAVLERDDSALGDGDLADRGGEVGERGLAVRIGLAGDIPGDVPDGWGDVSPPAGLAHVFFEEGAVDGREGLHGDKEVGPGGEPGGAVLGEAAAWDDVMAVRGGRERSAPGMEDASKTGQVGANTARLPGEPFERCCRSLAQSGVGNALMRTEKGA